MKQSSRETTGVRLLPAIAFCAASTAAAALPARAQWLPPGLVPTKAALRDVLAANARASGSGAARFARRRERWTYVNGTRRIAVSVAVRDSDFRTSLELDGLAYTAGRSSQARWRGDGNGIVHGVQADLQGDALDRAPQAIFPIDWTACSLVGETQLPAPAWVIETGPTGDKAAFLYVDEATGSVVREVMRDGKRVVTTSFDRFETFDGVLRARHWRVDDGIAANALDVTVDAIEPGVITQAEVAFPARRVFAPAAPRERSFDLPATFAGGAISVEVRLDGARRRFLLDTGTASITVDPQLVRSSGGPALEHAMLPRLAIGPLQLDRVSAVIAPFEGRGILGFDFFFGHVIEIDYRRERVRVLCADDARRVFADPTTTTIDANVDQGLPLVHAGFGAAQGDQFAIDTGSPRLYVTLPFALRFAQDIAANWTAAGASYVERYLEGEIEVKPYRVARFRLGNAVVNDAIVGAQVPTTRTGDLALPFEGIIGTDILRRFDLYFDYDNGRVAIRG